MQGTATWPRASSVCLGEQTSMLPCIIINDTWGGYLVLCALNWCAIGDSTVFGQGSGGSTAPVTPPLPTALANFLTHMSTIAFSFQKKQTTLQSWIKYLGCPQVVSKTANQHVQTLCPQLHSLGQASHGKHCF